MLPCAACRLRPLMPARSADKEPVTDRQQSQFPLGQYAVHNGRFIDASLRKVGAALVVVGLVLSWWQTGMAQQDPSALPLRKAEIEVQKLELEVAKLKKELVDWYKGLTAFLGFLTGIAGTAFSFWAARRARAGACEAPAASGRPVTPWTPRA